MNTLLQAISEGWSWKLGTPVGVVATNRFGNVIVRNQNGDFYRIMPEEWQCELLARTPAELDEKRKTESFVRDWEMTPLVDRAVAAHCPLAVGECFFLVVPGMLGCKYAEENIRKITLPELLSYSGSMRPRSTMFQMAIVSSLYRKKQRPTWRYSTTTPSAMILRKPKWGCDCPEL
jgi:hypothetical protein